ncbi:MAG: hypothetical protein HY314_04140 [Acidobacteria bacterium]|nr:hypothetical protein [Acidobacteriota bacterium]
MKKGTLHQRVIIGIFILMGLPVLARAQTSEAPFHINPHVWNSAVHDGESGPSAETILAESYLVRDPGAPWLQLHFGDAYLGARSFITITSLKDGALQFLDPTSLEQWQNTSAYFNGDALEIQLYVGPDDRGVFLQLKELAVGDPPTESQCGPTDDRVPSNNPAAGRLLSIGCTAWIISSGLQVTAGHCSGSSATTLEFNVPNSLSDGTIQHPPPQDQYAVDPASKVFHNNGIGDDWGTFQVFPNSTTGLLPITAQGASFTVVQNLGPPDIRITGYGIDNNDPTRNQTQQTHVGPNAGSSGTVMRYRTDTEGGNSGSPVIDAATGNAVGVHTNGGCTQTGGNNSGTATTNTAFWNALNPSPTITVTVPNGGESWQVGTMQTITWTSSNVSGNVKIALSRSGIGGPFETLFADTTNDGSEPWMVSGTTSSNCFVKISSVGNPAVSDLSNAAFTISAAPTPTITVVAPNGGENWQTGTAQTIQWTSSNVSGNVKIELSRSGVGGPYETLFADTTNDGSQSWTVAGATSSNCFVKISSVANAAVSDLNNTAFTISAPPTGPSITVLVPNGGEQWQIGTTQTIRWTSSGISGNVKIRLSRNGGSSYTAIFNSVANTGSIPWTVTGPTAPQCKIQIVSLNDPTIRDASDGNFSITP